MKVWIACGLGVLGACTKEEPRPAVTAEPVVSASASASASAVAPSVSVSAAPSTTVAATAAATASTPARVACGATTCAPNQFCLHYDPGSGGAYSPDKEHGDATLCSDTVLHTDSMSCGAPNAARHANCSARIPRAPPHGGN